MRSAPVLNTVIRPLVSVAMMATLVDASSTPLKRALESARAASARFRSIPRAIWVAMVSSTLTVVSERGFLANRAMTPHSSPPSMIGCPAKATNPSLIAQS